MKKLKLHSVMALGVCTLITACGGAPNPQNPSSNNSQPVTSSSTSTVTSTSSVGTSSSAPAPVDLVGYSTINAPDGNTYYEPVQHSEKFNMSKSLEAFKNTLYPFLRDSGCAACHNSAVPKFAGGNQAPMHSDNDVELAHMNAITRINYKDPGLSVFVDRMKLDRHNCPPAYTNCRAAGQAMEDKINEYLAALGDSGYSPTQWGIPKSQTITENQVNQWVSQDKTSLGSNAKYYIYASLHAVHNDPNLTADDLDTVRVGLVKALNSVARFAPEIVYPEELRGINGNGIVYKFDTRKLWGWNRGVNTLLFGGSDDDMAFANVCKYRADGAEVLVPSFGGGGNCTSSGTPEEQKDYNFTNQTVKDDAHALRIWQRVLHGNKEGAEQQRANLPPFIDGFKGQRSTNRSGPYVAVDDFEWVEAIQLIYTVTRPDVYNAIMMNPMEAIEFEKHLGVDTSQGMDSYDYLLVFDAITVDSRLLWRAETKNNNGLGNWYWKSWDVFSGQLAQGDQGNNIFEVYEQGGSDIRFPWWANPIPKFVSSRVVGQGDPNFSFIASLNQTSSQFGGNGQAFAAANTPGCDNQPGAVQGFGFCRHYTGVGGAMQSASEIIYDMPNGLQGYFLTGGFNQRRLDAFTNIVRDPRILRNAGDDIAHGPGYCYTNGSGGGFNFGGQECIQRATDPRLNIGSSCIGCHRDGMNRINNDLREWLDNAPDRLPKGPYGVDGWITDTSTVNRVKELYPENSEWIPQIEEDRHMFLETMGEIKNAVMWSEDKNVYVEPVIWSIEYARYTLYDYPATTSN